MRKLWLACGLLLLATTAAYAEISGYPPKGYWPIGTALATEDAGVPQDGCFFGLQGTVWVATQFLGSGKKAAKIVFSEGVTYINSNPDGTQSIQVEFGNIGILTFDSPAGGTIYMQGAIVSDDGGAPKPGNSFNFTVQKENHSATDLAFDFTIEFPDCKLHVNALYYTTNALAPR
jgi:hypothetical protein